MFGCMAELVGRQDSDAKKGTREPEGMAYALGELRKRGLEAPGSRCRDLKVAA
eukprot:CAMPEP_0206501360 /NCGR_PEP_ID=MMETSP0324_2-20121206/53264_1 /ASSEMBLY_ACC=CAM_ASM_000836 /TAXON_ID=2866 /ORGANISM="Crypthecodinium cohnii, Strain Seligo" /LENGTH=52 /DNA_ID=CAMNT_0053989165 /DNA_START=151 /DNA_END=309 /DNA_ORIENTATION=-